MMKRQVARQKSRRAAVKRNTRCPTAPRRIAFARVAVGERFAVLDDGRVFPQSHSYAQDAGGLTRAYAISIHKSQGAEYPVVVIVLLKDHYLLLHRQLLYTAVARAKQACVPIENWPSGCDRRQGNRFKRR